ncbi:MAG: hypothetical protein LBF59_07975 [Prevotellaceae bacterium]|nr:hypothetical protein [Prevotellaceae bacterium]
MKFINKIGIVVLTIVTLNVFISCEKEVVRDSSPEANPNSNRVYFPEQTDDQLVLGISDVSTPITIAREVSDNALTVSITITANAAFSIPQTVSFAAGDTATVFDLSIGDIELMKKYLVILNIDENQSNPYDEDAKFSTLALNILKEDFAPFAEGVYSSEFFEEEWPATLEYSPSTELYRLADCWMPDYDVLFKWEGTKVTIQGTKNSSGSYIYLPTGYVHPSYGMISAYYSQTDINYYNEATETFTFPITWVVSAGSFGEYIDTYTIETRY